MSNDTGKRHKRSKKPPPIIARGSSHPTAIFNLPPKKIIKATKDYQAQNAGELSFRKNDFFYVINDREDTETYEVINPLEKLRGIVHYHCFKSIERTAEQLSAPPQHDHQSQSRPSSRPSSSQNRPVSPRYGPISPQLSPEYQRGFVDSIYGSEFGGHFNDNQEYQEEFSNLPKDRLSEYRRQQSNDRRHTEYTELDYGRNEYQNGYQNEEYYAAYPYHTDNQGDDYTAMLSNQLQALSTNRSSADTHPSRTSRSSRPNLPPSEIIDVCTVVSCEVLNGDKWSFTIQVKYLDDRMDILHRSHDDIWALQVTLLTKFPVEAGRHDHPRSIPFLSSPVGGMDQNQAQEIRLELNRYLTELVQIPSHILYSPSVIRFFKTRPGDEQNAIISFDVADTLLDLLEDYQNHNEVTVKLVLGSEIIAWKTSEFICYDDLAREVIDKLGFRFDYLLYMDEVENMIPLQGDSDLRLLLSLGKLKFFVK
jgi:bud emergence protein 1